MKQKSCLGCGRKAARWSSWCSPQCQDEHMMDDPFLRFDRPEERDPAPGTGWDRIYGARS